MKIESTDQDIRTLLSSGYYKIPRFQRPYSWDRENIQEFWDDIVRDNPSDYFIGSMVVYKDGQQRYGVVDGQQRLTTITILLCVLRNTLARLGEMDLAEGIHGLIERRNIDNKLEFILSTETSYPFFQNRIQGWKQPEVRIEPLQEEANLEAAYKQLEALVSAPLMSLEGDTTLSKERRKELAKQKLISIRDALLNLNLIFIKLEDEDDAYIIFETLNTRGKDLSLTDLVKNHLTKHIKSRNPAADQTKIKWQQLLETIEGSSADLNTDTFIHHFWLSRYDYLPAKKLFNVLKKRIGVNDAPSFLDDLLSDAALYRAIHEDGYWKWAKEEERIQQGLAALMLFRVRQQTPCLLSLLRGYKNTGTLKKRHLEDAVIAIEKFHFLFTAVTSSRSSGGISVMYAALGRRLFEAKDTQFAVDVIRDLKQKLKDRVPSLDEVKALFPNIVYTAKLTRQRNLVKYILVGLEQASPSPIAVDYDQMTIEHLAPQSLIAKGELNEATVGQLGNLLLVSSELNAKLKDKSFEDKKMILQNHGFNLPEEIARARTWGETEIRQRTQKLAEAAYNTAWKI